MERTGMCFYLAIREDELCSHGEHAKCVLFPDGMLVLRGLKHQGVRGKQDCISGGTEGKNVQNGFRLHRNTHLGFCIERTLQAAHVKVDFHAKNVPVAFWNVEILCLSTDSLNEPLLVSFFSITLNRFTMEEKAHDNRSDPQ